MAETVPTAASSEPGRVLAGRYRLLSVLGRGGMGTVWRAEHLQLNALVAVKLIEPNATTGSAEALRQCQKEARAAAALRSPHVVHVMDFGHDEATGSPFIVMELLEGESLAERLARRGKLSPAETSRVLTHIARALGRAHEAGIVHRDLKPANVFLVRNDDEELAKVLDFGVARVQRADPTSGPTTHTRGIYGTPVYMSPEHITGHAVDGRTDLWAMAVMAFECITGRLPFESPELGELVLQICSHAIPIPSQVAPVPPGFDAWFQRATRREVDQRFQSARELADELRKICEESARLPPLREAENRATDGFTPGPLAHLLSFPRKRSRAGWWLTGALLLVMLGGIAVRLASRARRSGAAPSTSAPALVASPPREVSPPPASSPRVPSRIPAAPVAAPSAVAIETKETAAKPARSSGKRKPETQRSAPPTAKTASAKPVVPSVQSVLDHRR